MAIDGNHNKPDDPNESTAPAAATRKVTNLPRADGSTPLPPVGTGRTMTPSEMAAAHQARLEARAAAGVDLQPAPTETRQPPGGDNRQSQPGDADVYDPDLDELAAEALSEPRINYDDDAGAEEDARNPVLHITSEFHDQKMDMYTDLVHWRSGEAVRTELAKGTQDKESNEPARIGIADVPDQRDLGDDTLGEDPKVRPGDTRDRRTFGEKLLDEDSDPDETQAERLRKKYSREVSDIKDGVQDQVDNYRNALTHPQPAANAEVMVRHGPAAAPKEGQGSAANPDSVAQLIVVGGVLGIETYRWAHRRVGELIRRDDDDHG